MPLPVRKIVCIVTVYCATKQHCVNVDAEHECCVGIIEHGGGASRSKGAKWDKYSNIIRQHLRGNLLKVTALSFQFFLFAH